MYGLNTIETKMFTAYVPKGCMYENWYHAQLVAIGCGKLFYYTTDKCNDVSI